MVAGIRNSVVIEKKAVLFCISGSMAKCLATTSLLIRSAIFSIFSAPTEITNGFQVYYIPPAPARSRAYQKLCALSKTRKPKHYS